MPGFNPFDVTTKRVLKKLGGDKISSKVILDESLSSEPIDNFGGTFYANENADGTEIEVGKTYIVTIDSGSFTAVCKELADGFLYLGNAKPLGAEDTGESYCCFLMYEDGWAFGASDFNNGTHIKVVLTETIVPIDQRYLPGVCLPVVDLTGCALGEAITDETVITALNKCYAESPVIIGSIMTEGVTYLVFNKFVGMGFVASLMGGSIRLAVSDGNWTLSFE